MKYLCIFLCCPKSPLHVQFIATWRPSHFMIIVEREGRGRKNADAILKWWCSLQVYFYREVKGMRRFKEVRRQEKHVIRSHLTRIAWVHSSTYNYKTVWHDINMVLHDSMRLFLSPSLSVCLVPRAAMRKNSNQLYYEEHTILSDKEREKEDLCFKPKSNYEQETSYKKVMYLLLFWVFKVSGRLEAARYGYNTEKYCRRKWHAC